MDWLESVEETKIEDFDLLSVFPTKRANSDDSLPDLDVIKKQKIEK